MKLIRHRFPMKPFLFLLLTLIPLHAKIVEYELTVAEEPWAPDGMKPIRALTVNGGIPGPTLRFRVGDTARITVHNRLRHEETSTHWHGLLLSNAQDGVPRLTTPPIKPGTSHVFEFPLKHAGTYWYHSHTGLQEQRGVYGSIVVEPRNGEPIRADAEHVLVLSDWTRESPYEVMRTLMTGTDWYAIRKGNAQSIAGAAKAGALGDYFQRERSRMAPMDISDVAYDAFLVNGQRQIELGGKPGQKIRLRVINAAASSYFYLSSSAGPMNVVAADGPAVSPVKMDRILMGMAETYDIIVTVPKSGKWEFRATAQDGSGHASAFFGNGELNPAQDPPKPNLYSMDDMLAGALEAMDGDGGIDMARPPAPYRMLRSPQPTTLPKTAPRRTLELRLTGDMERYIWAINGKTAREDAVIKVTRGEVLRLVLVNDTMMHHPMHLHGHFFRVIDGDEDARAPLKHTIDVPPMGRRTIEFLADEYGDWLFHCHLLYHMHAGMTRVFSYDDQGEDHTPDLGEMAEDRFVIMASGNVQNHMSMGMVSLMNSRNDFMAMWDVGIHHETMGGNHDHHFEYEIDFLWKRYIDPNLSTHLGYRITNQMEAEDRFIGGVEYRLPYMIWAGVTLDSEGDARISLAKDFQLTSRLSLITEGEYDTGSQWEWSAGLNYTLTKRFSLISEYHSEHGFGGGIGFRF
jgi:FtsP/CotA-like multicopper oxidase with cupredoxin domain